MIKNLRCNYSFHFFFKPLSGFQSAFHRFLYGSMDTSLPLTKKIRPLTDSRSTSMKKVKKIFGEDIYIFIHLPALYLNAFLFHFVPNREGTKLLELKLNRQIFNPRLFNSRYSAFLQTSELNLLNI